MLQTHLGVRFVGGADRLEPRESSGPLAIDRRVAIAARLRGAIALGDIGAIQELSQHLIAGDEAEREVGERVRGLAAAFDFAGLSELAESLASET
jgi:hypothetical protein